MPAPLAQLRLLDLSRQLPGPFCSTVLADLGMDVLTITAPNDPFGTGMPLLARNKRSMTLNLKHDTGREILLRLVDQADALLEGFRPGVMDRLGVGWETLRARNPRLVYCAITGYGQTGPYRDRVGHDLNYLSYAGVLNVIGEPGRPPVIPGVQIADLGGGALMAAVGILAALTARQQTGTGQFVDVSMLDGAVAWNVYHLLLHVLHGQAPGRGEGQLTGRHPCFAVYETRHLGREDFIPHQWDEGAKREEMFAVLRGIFRGKTLAEWDRELAELEICYGPVHTIEEALDDPQIRHRGMIATMDTAMGPMLMPGPPIKLSATPASLRTPPARLGEHTDAVLAGLGYDDAAIGRLRAAGVV
jgi:crotonobetainyl-CoA:carnitine CoA-transferase CaiB-like acyl-CoA transferase